MLQDANDRTILWFSDLLEAANSHGLHVRRVDWVELPEALKANFNPVLQRRRVDETLIDSCLLAHVGDDRVAVVYAREGDGGEPEDSLILIADNDGLFVEWQAPPEDDEWPQYDIMARGRPYLIPIVQQILADGKPRTAEEILEIGIAKGLLPKTTLRKNLYGHLIQYIERTKAHGRKPLIIQNPTDRTFSINQPPDDWPDIPIPEPPEPSPQVKQVIDRLTATSTGTNPTDFELAVCEAFEQLGYIAKHIGGEMNPDGIIDAPLGPKAYRSIVECKTSVKGLVPGTEFVTEAIKYKDAYHADYCIVVGPRFGQLGTLDSELQTHKVALWTVADLVRALTIRTNPYEMIPLFGPGRASNALDDIEWERRHGRAKRVRTIANVLMEEGWKAQVLAAKESPREEAPLLTEDAAMMLGRRLVGKTGRADWLHSWGRSGSVEFLTSPIIGRALYVDEGRRAVVVVRSDL